MPPKPKFAREQEVQNWLESAIAADDLRSLIFGIEEVDEALNWRDSDQFWPPFPIDYLARMGNLRAAKQVLGSLHSLELVSKNNRSISREKGESLFVDLLYCTRETSQFVLFEIKNQRASVRETVSELVAYEHEAMNHMPFMSSNDMMMVVVSREFSTLLDHAVTGLNTWSRQKILCLKFDDSGDTPRLEVHLPRAWTAIGQNGLAPSGLQTAAISFEPRQGLSEDDVHAVCSTAATLMVREAERSGGSGFAMVVHNLLYPGMAEGPFLLLVGAVNPFSFLEAARAGGFLENAGSPISEYVLAEERADELPVSWDWLTCDGGAAVQYLRGFGSTTWESFSNWRHIRSIHRWQSQSITLDRHLTPVSIDFWGILGDFARDIVRRTDRMRSFMPGFVKPGIDWRNPTLGVLLLDEIALESPIESGQWTFSVMFSFGLRLGRLGAFGAQFADSDKGTQRKLMAALFWAEVDAIGLIHEVGQRYLAAREIVEPIPVISLGRYQNGEEIMAELSAFAQWFIQFFIGVDHELLTEAFVTGLRVYSIFDPQFDYKGDDPEIAAMREEAVLRAREWLKWSIMASLEEGRDRTITDAIQSHFDGMVPLAQGKEAAFGYVDELDADLLLEKLFVGIPKIVDSWLPQLAHTLAPIAVSGQDWIWYQDQIRAARARGEANPCLFLGPGGQLVVGRVPEEHLVPKVDNWETHVLFVNNESGVEIIMVKSWASLRAGNAPGMRPVDSQPHPTF